MERSEALIQEAPTPTQMEEFANQQVLERVHGLGGSLRGLREAVARKASDTRAECLEVCRKHGSWVLDVATSFVDELKKTLLK